MPLDAITTIPEPAIACPAGEWCWARNRPLTVGGDRALGTAYAIGSDGSFFHWSGDRWSAAPVPTRRTITSAQVLGPREAWASDDAGSAWRFDGAAWSEAPAEVPIARLLADPDGGTWAVGGGTPSLLVGSDGPSLLRHDGARWAQAVPPHPYCFGGDYLVRAGGEVWSAGMFCDASGVAKGIEVRRFDGASWVLVGAPIAGHRWFTRFEIVGERVRVIGEGAQEWDGAAWSPVVQRPLPPQQLPVEQSALWDGLGYTVVPSNIGCRNGFRLDAARAWCSGEGGVFTETTQGWARTIVDGFDETRPDAEWGTVPVELWAGGDTQVAWGTGPDWIYRVRHSTGGQLERRRGGYWFVELEDRVVDVHGVAEGQTAWAVTSERALRLRGGRCAQWIEEPLPGPEVFGPIGRLVAVRVFDPQNVFVLGSELLLRFDGTGWSLVASAPRDWGFSSLAGSGPDDLWLVRLKGGRYNDVAIAHSDGLGFTDVDVPGASVFGRLSTIDGETWLSTIRQIVRLGPTLEAHPVPLQLSDPRVWVSPAQIWLSSATQSVNRTR